MRNVVQEIFIKFDITKVKQRPQAAIHGPRMKRYRPPDLREGNRLTLKNKEIDELHRWCLNTSNPIHVKPVKPLVKSSSQKHKKFVRHSIDEFVQADCDAHRASRIRG
jgi:hypothetical protein